MIFNTITNDLNGAINKIGIFNRSFADLKNAISANGIKGLFNSISPAITSNDLSLIKEYNRLVGVEGVSSQTAWYRTMMSSSRSAQALFDDENNLIRTNNGLILSEETLVRATNTMTLGAKAASVALKAFSIAANMIAFTLITKGIQLVVSSIKNWIHSIDVAKEELEDANSKLEEINSELETTASRIDELNAKENLSLAEAEELDKLKETNKELERELRIREDIAKVKGEKANKEALLYFDSESGTKAESFWAQLKKDITTFDFFRKSSLYEITNPTYAYDSFNPRYNDKISEVESYIKQAEKLEQQLSKIADTESDEYKSVSADLKRTEEKLSKMITEFMEKDDLLIEGEDNGLLERLDALYERYDAYTNGRAYVVENRLSSILAKADFSDNAKALEELGKSGELSLDTLSSKFPNLIAYLNEAGISAQELYQYIMALSNPDAINYSNVKKQLLYSIGGRQDEAQESLREILSLDEEELVLTAYLKVRAQYGDHPEGWTAEDWAYNIQQELNDNPVEIQASPTFSISSTISQLNTQLKPAMDSLASAYNDIFTSDGEFALNSIDILSTCDSIKSKLDELNGLEGITVDYSSFEDFVRILNNTESEQNDVAQAFDSLATSITQAALKGTEDFETMKAALEDLGVVNNKIIAFDALAGNAEMLDEALSQANASMDDFIINTEDGSVAATEAGQKFLEEKAGAENYAEALNILAFHKQLCNEQGMNTAGEVANLRTLAENAGYTGDVIRYLTELEQIYQEVASGTMDPVVMGAKLGRAAMLQAMIRETADKINYEADYKPLERSAAKAGSSAGKAAGESYKDALKDELSDLNSVISYIGDTIDKQIDQFEDQKDAAVDALEAEKEAAEAALEAEKALVQEKIDAKQAEIDAIGEAAKARKNEMDLQKAQYDLERMQNQKTTLVYSGEKGMHYVADTKEIRDAEEAVTEARENIRIAGMQKEIASLNILMDDLDKKIEESNKYYGRLIEETEKYWDSLIKGLEEYKSRWKELADIEEQAKMEVALRRLGITTDDVLNMSGSAFESFKGTYLGLLQEMYSGNDDMIGMLQRFGGISTDTLSPLSGTIGTVADSLDRFASSTGNADISTSGISESVGTLNANAAGLGENLSGVSDTLDRITEEDKLETTATWINGIAAAVQSVSDALSDMPTDLDMGNTIAQFDALGNSVDKVATSLSGGTVSKADTSGKPTGKNTPGAQNSPGNGSNNLVSSIKEVRSETDRSIGTGEDSGAIGQFNQLGHSVTDVTTAVGGGSGSRGNNSGDGDSGNLIDSIETLGETTAETLGESDGEGTIGKFEEFGVTVAGAEGHVNGIIEGLHDLDGLTAECTITVNIETAGGLPDLASGTAISDTIGSMNLNSSEHKTKHVGRAGVAGTANITGNWGIRNPGKTLVGELGQEIWVHARNGTFETVGDNGAEFIHTEKGDLIFNHLQTQELLNRGRLTGRGKVSSSDGRAYINGTNGVTVTPDGTVYTPYDPETDTSMFGQLFKAWNKHYGNMDDNVEKIQETLSRHVTMEHNQQMHETISQITRNSNVVTNRNVQPSINVGDINITCPGVTDQQVLTNVGLALEEKFRGFSNYTDQWSRT